MDVSARELMPLVFGAVTLIPTLVYLVVRVRQLAQNLHTLWQFTIRRAKVEAILAGWGVIRSPLRLTPEAIALLTPLIVELATFYTTLIRENPRISEVDLFIAFENRFGDVLVEKVCIPHRLTRGACVIAAIEVSKQHIAQQEEKSHGRDH